MRLRCYRSRITWTLFLRNIWYNARIQRMFVTTSPRWIFHQGKWRRQSSPDIIKPCYHCYKTIGDTLQALHTSFVNTTIDNMKDNRVLHNRPPPINDEETHLSRRQRTTLSQLRSGHCKLMNSYKKRLKQSDFSSCPDHGMVPQDVPHLFDCTAHPNDLSPVNLWDKPVETIRELSFLDPGNMD